MAIQTPGNTVALGREGTGVAQIFGREGNPMDAFRQRKAEVERKNLLQAERVRLQKEKRDKDMLTAMAVDPEKTFQPFNDQVMSAAKSHTDRIENYFNAGGSSNPSFQTWNKQEWAKVNDMARRGNYIKDVIAQTEKRIDDNPYLKGRKTDIMKRVFDTYMNPDGSGKPFDQINENEIANIPDSPEFYDVDKLVDDFVQKMDENTASWVERRNTAYGLESDEHKTSYRQGLFTPAPTDKDGKSSTKSGLMEDEYGNPIVNIQPEIRNALVNSSPDRLAAIAYQADRAKMAPEEFIDAKIKEKLSGMGGGYKVGPTQFGQKFYPKASVNEVDETTGLKVKDLPKADLRMKNIGEIMNAFWDTEGGRRDTPTPEAMQALAYVKQNAKFGNGQILDAVYVPGTNAPGTTAAMGMNVANNPSDRMVMKVSYPGQKGKVKPESISLDDESGASLNSLFETATAEGKTHFGYDQLRMRNEQLSNSLFTPRIDREFNNKRVAEAEQGQVEKWQNLEDLNSMVGKVLDGKTITKVEPTPGPGVTSWFGNTAGLTIKFSDGTQQEIDEDDSELYNKLADIYKADAEEMIPVVSPQGTPGKIPASLLENALKAGFKQQ